MTTYVAIVGENKPEVLDAEELGKVYSSIWPERGECAVTVYAQAKDKLIGPLHQIDSVLTGDDAAVYYMTELYDVTGGLHGAISWDRVHG